MQSAIFVESVVLLCMFFSTWLVSLQRRRSSPDGIAESILGVYLNVKSISHGLGVSYFNVRDKNRL